MSPPLRRMSVSITSHTSQQPIPDKGLAAGPEDIDTSTTRTRNAIEMGTGFTNLVTVGIIRVAAIARDTRIGIVLKETLVVETERSK